ncbi:GNAT family N-acetyltransferase [Iodidimonas sp. SYSU 1G8]|uniref:GNAT family N-acetyltransferase n=1 Tax=Iodidimonas sp. SYSU 1G8 TaxID=3133967 RepID=UPI0031FF461C
MANRHYRRAVEADLPELVRLLADDELGSRRELREAEDQRPFRDAFHEIDSDPNQYLLVVEEDGALIGMLQLTFISGLARGGLKRGQIEAVRIARHRRSAGVGQAMVEWAISRCRDEGCGLVQLTTDRSRTDAHRFYERLGFEPSHVGYKLNL